jgi:hypothetical protein
MVDAGLLITYAERQQEQKVLRLACPTVSSSILTPYFIDPGNSCVQDFDADRSASKRSEEK